MKLAEVVGLPGLRGEIDLHNQAPITKIVSVQNPANGDVLLAVPSGMRFVVTLIEIAATNTAITAGTYLVVNGDTDSGNNNLGFMFLVPSVANAGAVVVPQNTLLSSGSRITVGVGGAFSGVYILIHGFYL